MYNGKSLILSDGGAHDPVVQHLTALAYYGHYLRDFVRNFWVHHTLEVPTFDLSIGFGGDILNTLSYYVIGDPLTVLSVFCPMQYTEYLYDFLIFLRLYLSGVAFSMYCRYQGKRQLDTLTGSLIYIFSAYPLLLVTRHPYFINPMIYLPLILVGVDKLLKKEGGKLLYTGMIAIAAISNFYFFYMLCIIICIYTVFRYFMIFGKIQMKHLLNMFLKFVFLSLLGIGMASILFLPVSMNILSSARLSVENEIPFLYQPSYYLSLLGNIMMSGYAENFSYLGYTAMGFLAVAVLFIKKKKSKINRYFCRAFLLLSVFLMIPYFGHMFNGMAYVTNRWIWALDFLVALVTVYMLPELPALTLKERKKLLIISVVYAVIIISFQLIRTELSMAALVCLAAVLLVITLIQNRAIQIRFSWISLVLVMGMLWMNNLYLCSTSEVNYVSRFADAGTGINLIKYDAPGAILDEVENSSKYRYDTAAISTKNIRYNSAMLLNKNSTSFYFNCTDPLVVQFNKNLYLNSTMEWRYLNMDSRSYLDAFLGAKYCIVPKGREKFLPYGYERLVKSGEIYKAYATEYAFPLCFSSNKWISSATFEQLSVTKKQQALLQGIVVDHVDGLAKADLSFSDSSRDITVKNNKGVTQQGNCFHVTKENATVTLSFDGLKNSETYLVIDNLHFKGINPYQLYSKQELQAMSRYERNQLKKKYRYWSEPTMVDIQAKMGECSKVLQPRTAKSPHYCNIHDLLVNMGYNKESSSSITLTFQQIGDYSYDSLSVVCQPMDRFGEQCNAMKTDVPSKMECDSNKISTSISTDSDKLVCFAIPYNEGWTAFVDGEEQKLMVADEMFMALKIEKGTHDIVLRYHTPYLKEGALISLVSAIVFLCLAVLSFGKGRRRGIFHEW